MFKLMRVVRLLSSAALWKLSIIRSGAVSVKRPLRYADCSVFKLPDASRMYVCITSIYIAAYATSRFEAALQS